MTARHLLVLLSVAVSNVVVCCIWLGWPGPVRSVTRFLAQRRSWLFGFLVLAPLVVLTILFGVYPAPILDTSAAAVGLLVQNLADVFGGAASVPAAVVAH